jgi:hypothetical protein
MKKSIRSTSIWTTSAAARYTESSSFNLRKEQIYSKHEKESHTHQQRKKKEVAKSSRNNSSRFVFSMATEQDTILRFVPTSFRV